MISERLGLLIKRIQHGHHRALDRGLVPLGVSLVQWNALREIERNPGCSQHHLAEQSFNSDQALGALLKRLQLAGLIERRPGSGRAAAQGLTAQGLHLLHEGQKVMSEVTAHSFSRLTDREQLELERLLTAVLNRLEREAILDERI